MAKNKSYLEIHSCKKCGHKWPNRKDRKPRLCPKCKSVNWDEEKKT